MQKCLRMQYMQIYSIYLRIGIGEDSRGWLRQFLIVFETRNIEDVETEIFDACPAHPLRGPRTLLTAGLTHGRTDRHNKGALGLLVLDH